MTFPTQGIIQQTVTTTLDLPSFSAADEGNTLVVDAAGDLVLGDTDDVQRVIARIANTVTNKTFSFQTTDPDYTLEGDMADLVLGNTQAEFDAIELEITRNGVPLDKGSEVIYVGSRQARIPATVYAGERITARKAA